MDERLRKLIADLLSDDLDVEGQAIDRFYELNDESEFDADDLVALVCEAEAIADPGRDDQDDPAQKLLVFAADIAEACGSDAAPAIEAVRRVMPRLGPAAKSAALLVLTRIPVMESVLVYAELLGQHGADLPSLGLPVFLPEVFEGEEDGEEDGGEASAKIFPRVLELAHTREQRDQLYLMMLTFLEQGQLESKDIASHESDFLALLREEAASVRKHQHECSPGRYNWKYESPYQEHRHTLGIMLDVAGWWGTDALLDAIATFDDLHDSHLRLLRAISLLRAGRRVPVSELEWIAQWPRERLWLHRKLTEMGRTDDLPESCRDQAKLAEGQMVDWLCFGTELGREPSEIELVHVECRDVKFGRGKAKPTDYYFYRFRVTEDHWSKESGWMVGMAGGFQRSRGGEVTYTGDTFSHFARWEDKTLEEHVASFLDDDNSHGE